MSRITGSIRIWQPTELPGATLLRGDLASHSFPRHTHDELVIGFNVRGAHSFWCRGGMHEVPPGTIALVNAGDVHTGDVLGDDGWEYRAFYLTRELLDATATDAGLSSGAAVEFPKCTVRDRALARALSVAHDVLGTEGADALERETMALTVVARLLGRHAALRAPTRATPPRRALAQVQDFIRSEYRRTIRLSELQAISGYGKVRLISAFRAAYGQPPYELVIALRVAEARRRLARRESIASVAIATGFADQSHLTRQFKRITGVTPGQYVHAFS